MDKSVASKAVQADSSTQLPEPSNRRAPPGLFVVPPIKDHKQTFILLHGKGDYASSFGEGFVHFVIPSYGSFQQKFPHAKFIFPQAPMRATARARGWKMPQWFDNWGYDESGKDKEDLKIEGLTETTMLVHELLEEEIERVGAENVVLGGLSQGCAASLVALITWQGKPFAGCLEMCGHLPFRTQIEAAAELKNPTQDLTSASRVVSWLRNKIRLPDSNSIETPFTQIPIFLAHGDRDTVVPTRLGREASHCLKVLETRVEYHEYPGLAHWYNEDMLREFVEHLKRHTRWQDDTADDSTK